MGASNGGYVTRKKVVTIATAVADSTEIPYQDVEHAAVTLDAGTAPTTLTFYGATEQGGTFYPVYTSANALVTRTVVHTRGYAFPDECKGFASIKITGNVAGTGVVSSKAVY